MFLRTITVHSGDLTREMSSR